MNSRQNRIEASGLQGLAILFRLLPRRAALLIGEALGGLVFFLGVRRQVALDNLAQAFPQQTAKQRRQLARACYHHFGALLVEFARLPLLNPRTVSRWVDFQNREALDQAIKDQRGGIVVSGHLGNWELMGSAVAILGYPVAYVVTGQQNELIEASMDRVRQITGVRIIKRRDAMKEVLKTLRSNGLVAILSDQDAHEAGAFVPFFGRLASTPRGAALFALRTGAHLIFAESYRRRDGKLKVVLERMPLEDLPAGQEQAIHELVRRFTARLEDAIRRHPEQWFWMHRRWKTPPPNKEGPSS